MKQKIIVMFILLLILSIVADFSFVGEMKDGYVDRNPIGEEDKEINLQLEVDGIIDGYNYAITVPSALPTKEEADRYFKESIEQIDREFTEVEKTVPVQEEYADGLVKADWSFSPYGIVDAEGKILFEKIETEVVILHAQVELQCGNYEKIHTFPFEVKVPKPTREEYILQCIEDWLDNQMKIEGNTSIRLPTELNGEKLQWSEKREFITPQVFVLEMVALLLLKIVSKRKREEREKKCLAEMERDYPEIVNQLSLLMSAGMTARQAWSRIAMQYEYKRKEALISENRVYEAILQMNRRFKEGESERVVYKRFTEDIPAVNYRKLMRLLLSNLEKGTSGIAARLEEESRLAFEQKILRAKKIGEEASTKMLLPLMLMLVLVMGIVLLPAIMKFQI